MSASKLELDTFGNSVLTHLLWSLWLPAAKARSKVPDQLFNQKTILSFQNSIQKASIEEKNKRSRLSLAIFSICLCVFPSSLAPKQLKVKPVRRFVCQGAFGG